MEISKIWLKTEPESIEKAIEFALTKFYSPDSPVPTPPPAKEEMPPDSPSDLQPGTVVPVYQEPIQKVLFLGDAKLIALNEKKGNLEEWEVESMRNPGKTGLVVLYVGEDSQNPTRLPLPKPYPTPPPAKEEMPPDSPVELSVAQAAKAAGMSRQGMYAAIKRKQIPTHKKVGRVKVYHSDVIKFLDSRSERLNRDNEGIAIREGQRRI